MAVKQRQESPSERPSTKLMVDVDRVREGTPKPIFQRMQQIEALEDYHEYFHVGIPNNYVFLLINTRYSLQEYLYNIAVDTSPLNKANARVYDYCAEKVEKMPRRDVVSHGLLHLMNGWKKTIDNGMNLQGVAFSEKAFHLMAELGVDVRSRWRIEDPEIRGLFTHVPHKIESLLRINLSIPSDLVVSSLAEFMQEVFRFPEPFSLIERVEIAKPFLKNDSDVKNFPTIIFYLVDEANDGARFEAVDHLFRLLQPIFKNFGHGLDAEPGFADLLHPFVTVAQGYKLWKRYLRVMDLLDEIYDRDFNYAYLKSDSGSGLAKQRNFPRVLSKYRT